MTYYKTEGALHGHYIMCYSEQYLRLKRNVFSPRRKATVDFVLFNAKIGPTDTVAHVGR